VRSLRLHPARLLTRLEVAVPAVRPLTRRVLRRQFDLLAGRWDTIRGDFPDSRAILTAALDELAPRPRRMLDVGTGTGQAALVLLERFAEAELVGLDASPQMVDRAQAKLGSDRARFVVADGNAMPFADGAFDLAVAMLVQPFAAELHRVLAVGGLALHVYPVGDRTPIWFPQDRLARELRRAGFVDVRFGRHADGEWTAAFKSA
jgi:ubiquinone/menaquinone biosynthesis C-methylase UbiE